MQKLWNYHSQWIFTSLHCSVLFVFHLVMSGVVCSISVCVRVHVCACAFSSHVCEELFKMPFKQHLGSFSCRTLFMLGNGCSAQKNREKWKHFTHRRVPRCAISFRIFEIIPEFEHLLLAGWLCAVSTESRVHLCIWVNRCFR